MIESNSPAEDATSQDLERLQASIDRARAAAQRSLHRNMAELRHVQTERVYRSHALPKSIDTDNMGQASARQSTCPPSPKTHGQPETALATERAIAFGKERYRQIQEAIAKQTQSATPAPQSAGSTEQTQWFRTNCPQRPVPLRLWRKIQAVLRQKGAASPLPSRLNFSQEQNSLKTKHRNPAASRKTAFSAPTQRPTHSARQSFMIDRAPEPTPDVCPQTGAC